MPFQDTTQNLRRRRLLRVEDWWFCHHQSMIDVSMNVFPMNLIQIEDLILFAHKFCRYVKHFLQGEIWCIHNGILIVLEILTHECRHIHRRSHKHSPNYWMFFSWTCNVWHSFLSFSHLITHPIHEWSWFYSQFQFCFIVYHDEILKSCHFLRIDIIRSPWSITKCFSVPYGLRISVEKSFSVIRSTLMYHSPRSFIRLPWSIVRRSLTFPLLNNLLNQIVKASNKSDHNPILNNLPRAHVLEIQFIRLPSWSIIYNNRSPRILFSITDLPRASWWSWRRHDREFIRHPRSKDQHLFPGLDLIIGHRFWFYCDSFSSRFLLKPFCHCSGANCRTKMANVKQAH